MARYEYIRGLGTDGRDLVKSFISQPFFSESYEEDLEDVLDVYEDMETMCDVDSGQNRKAMSITLKANARVFYHQIESTSKDLKSLRTC